ncbi:protein FAM228B isoform X2 [Pithys albifrons albifrons]|uniref:protein FAM228B isoform X2 n=1 Tax=Pithys albifrons albifrons TaxID=3385563 RepID=UPI003A5D14FA
MAARDAARLRAEGPGRAPAPAAPAVRGRERPRCRDPVPTARLVPGPARGSCSSREAVRDGRETLLPGGRTWRGAIAAVRLVQGFTPSLSQKNKTTWHGRKSVKDGMTKEPMAPVQTSPTMRSVNSSETPWLQKMTCLRPVTAPDQQRLQQVTPDQSRDIIASVQCILDRENCFVRELDRYLRHNDFLNLRKKEIVYKEWLKNVSEPLLQKIEDKMCSQSIEEIQKRKQEQLSQYLNYCKKKVTRRSTFLSWGGCIQRVMDKIRGLTVIHCPFSSLEFRYT